MKHRHYAPKAQVILVEGNFHAVTCKIQKLAQSYIVKCAKVGVLATDETQHLYKANVIKSLGSRFNLPASPKTFLVCLGKSMQKT